MASRCLVVIKHLPATDLAGGTGTWSWSRGPTLPSPLPSPYPSGICGQAAPPFPGGAPAIHSVVSVLPESIG